ncbi:crosslink repair DNA glycosylase YcaQ family protein [Paucibacter sp. APW11]|uniref:Crosslink repair DNA glycosylase YcaQ family protein n=1 Tax=Roseateles aquae TaxID=3077235 RepID=A0ABU3PCT0_9BURK|nr:crosslink repair DNA glycosylase YcaQ family protein [Paucibacter sp. APW11]MDT8999671.1 crosslink repair DNA glycosylase YcaQ family protein [Paucibacter sp. APW11]
MSKAPSLDDLRRYAIARSLFKPTTLPQAINKLGFVQADPIRAPARAQDLTLRHRVRDYRAGDLERRYPKLDVEEDCLVNYGFLPRQHLSLLHPREAKRAWDAKTRQRAAAIRAFIAEQGPSHPRLVQQHFDLGRSTNAWGGSGNATTKLLDGMHYRGLLRVTHREQGQRIYAHVEHSDDPRSPQQKAEALLGLVLAKYAPLPSRSLGQLASLLGYGAPHLRAQTRHMLQTARQLWPSVDIDGQRWYWPEGEQPRAARWRLDEELRLLAPFDPVVWDRLRFEQFWGWAYRFEAYTPPAKRKLGYYALPLLWRGEVLGWANASVDDGELHLQCGFVAGQAPRDPAFKAALERETERFSVFLGLASA